MILCLFFIASIISRIGRKMNFWQIFGDFMCHYHRSMFYRKTSWSEFEKKQNGSSEFNFLKIVVWHLQAAMLDAWLAMHDDNLYPCREEKERLAKNMSMTYIQVTFFFYSEKWLNVFVLYDFLSSNLVEEGKHLIYLQSSLIKMILLDNMLLKVFRRYL